MEGPEIWKQQMVFINCLTPTPTHFLAFAADSWCWKSLSLSFTRIWDVGALTWRESELPDIQMPMGPRCFMPALSEAPDSLFIWTLLLQRASHSRPAALQLMEPDMRGQTPRVRSSESRGLDLEISAEDRGLLLAEATQPPWVDDYNNTQNWESDFWDDLIKRRYAYRKHSAESNVNTMHPRLQSKPKKRSPRNLGFGESKKKKKFTAFMWLGRFSMANFASTKTRKLRGDDWFNFPQFPCFCLWFTVPFNSIWTCMKMYYFFLFKQLNFCNRVINV